MRFDGRLRRNVVEVAHASEVRNVLRPLGSKASHVDEVVRETEVEIIPLVNLRDVVMRELQAQGFDVGLEIGDVIPTDQGEHVWGLGQDT